MTSAARQAEFYTVEEYLDWERLSEVKNEYYDGSIVMMAGGSPDHSLIAANVVAELHGPLRGSGCHVYGSDLKVRSGPNQFVYPDVTVVCGELQFHDAAQDVVTNPHLIVEVLSPSTEAVDRGIKWMKYQRLASLTDYLMVSQQEPRVEHYYRDAAGEWQQAVSQGLESELRLPSLDCVIALRGLYAGVAFAPSAD